MTMIDQLDIDQFDDEGFASSLSGTDVHETARRQFIASVAVAAVILVGFALAAVSPTTHREAAAPAPHRLAGVQQPILMPTPAQRFASAVQRQIELP